MFVALVVLAVSVGVASALTDGELDGDGHPNVVLILIAVDEEPAFRCSATLLDPIFVLKAGHCTNFFPDGEFFGNKSFYGIRFR